MGTRPDQRRFAAGRSGHEYQRAEAEAAAENWTTQQLTEFLSAVSSFTEERDLLPSGVEHVAEAMCAEIAAIIRDGRVEASIGFTAGSPPESDLVEAAAGPSFERELGELGVCTGISCSLDDDGTTLLAARVGRDEFTQGQMSLLRGMGRVLALSLRSVQLIGELRERQTLLERLTTLQRSIASRDDLEEVFDAIVRGASELLGDEVVDLSLIDPEEPSMLEIVASAGFSDELLEKVRRTPVNQGTAGYAIIERRPIVVEDYGSDPRHIPDLAVDGLRSVISAPVYQRGELVGALSLGTREPGRRYREAERDAVLAFAEHAGLALNDAKAAAETAHQAFHDPLTGLANRALFLDRLESGEGPRRALRRVGRGPVRGSGRLQDPQRQPGPCRRRPAVDHRRTAFGLGHPAGRHSRAIRR